MKAAVAEFCSLRTMNGTRGNEMGLARVFRLPILVMTGGSSVFGWQSVAATDLFAAYLPGFNSLDKAFSFLASRTMCL